MSVKKIYSFPLILILVLFMLPALSVAQIIEATGKPTEASSQLIYYYNQEDGDSTIQVTNTNDTTSVWIHVQIFRSFDPDEGDDNVLPVICDERNFVDLLTPNDTHVYDLENDNFVKNMGEDGVTQGETTSIIDISDTVGFIVITPVVSEADLTAISFQHMTGISSDDDAGESFILNAMGRDAVDFATGETLADGTPLDGVTNGFVNLQPGELLIEFGVDDNVGNPEADIVGIAFLDQYGPPGLLGYQVIPGLTTWTSFIFDFKEDPTSCGVVNIGCFAMFGLNDTIEQAEEELENGAGEVLLCGGASTPEYDPMGVIEDPDEGNDAFEPNYFGWLRIFVSGVDPFENHLALFFNDDINGTRWFFTRD